MQPKGSFGTFDKLLTVYSEGKGKNKRKSEEKRGKSEREGEKKTAIIALLNFFLFIIGVANGTSKNVVLGKILAGSRDLGSVFDKSRSLVFSSVEVSCTILFSYRSKNNRTRVVRTWHDTVLTD